MTDREKFESWLTNGASDLSKMLLVDKFDGGGYSNNMARIQWEAWQAALASQQPEYALVQRALDAEGKLYTQENIIPDGLNRSTADLVLGFAKALAEKLYRSEQKYGWSDGWKESDWQDKCLADFHHHISKGDPRDVAAYCAFMWHHGWKTSSRQQPADDGWIEWKGGECPVNINSLVNVRYKNGGGDLESSRAEVYNWSHNDKDCCPIVAYRVVKP